MEPSAFELTLAGILLAAAISFGISLLLDWRLQR